MHRGYTRAFGSEHTLADIEADFLFGYIFFEERWLEKHYKEGAQRAALYSLRVCLSNRQPPVFLPNPKGEQMKRWSSEVIKSGGLDIYNNINHSWRPVVDAGTKTINDLFSEYALPIKFRQVYNDEAANVVVGTAGATFYVFWNSRI